MMKATETWLVSGLALYMAFFSFAEVAKVLPTKEAKFWKDVDVPSLSVPARVRSVKADKIDSAWINVNEIAFVRKHRLLAGRTIVGLSHSSHDVGNGWDHFIIEEEPEAFLARWEIV